MTTLAVTNTLANGQALDATKVETNFSDIETYVNTNCILKDGTLSMTAPLTVPRTGVKARRAANQSIASGSDVTVSFDTEDSDSDAYFAPTSTTFTVPAARAGVYIATVDSVSASFAALTKVFVNGVQVYSTLDSSVAQVYGATLLVLAVADVVTVKLRQNSGGAINYTAGFQMYRLMP